MYAYVYRDGFVLSPSPHPGRVSLDLELTPQPMPALDSLLSSYLSLLRVGITGVGHSTRLWGMQKIPCSHSINRCLVYARLCTFTIILEVSEIRAQKNPVTACNLLWLNMLRRWQLSLDGSSFKVNTPFPSGYILKEVGFISIFFQAQLFLSGKGGTVQKTS